jgi:hypothetical protein
MGGARTSGEEGVWVDDGSARAAGPSLPALYAEDGQQDGAPPGLHLERAEPIRQSRSFRLGRAKCVGHVGFDSLDSERGGEPGGFRRSKVQASIVKAGAGITFSDIGGWSAPEYIGRNSAGVGGSPARRRGSGGGGGGVANRGALGAGAVAGQDATLGFLMQSLPVEKVLDR